MRQKAEIAAPRFFLLLVSELQECEESMGYAAALRPEKDKKDNMAAFLEGTQAPPPHPGTVRLNLESQSNTRVSEG